jgi:hypothetical protein
VISDEQVQALKAIDKEFPPARSMSHYALDLAPAAALEQGALTGSDT